METSNIRAEDEATLEQEIESELEALETTDAGGDTNAGINDDPEDLDDDAGDEDDC